MKWKHVGHFYKEVFSTLESSSIPHEHILHPTSASQEEGTHGVMILRKWVHVGAGERQTMKEDNKRGSFIEIFYWSSVRMLMLWARPQTGWSLLKPHRPAWVTNQTLTFSQPLHGKEQTEDLLLKHNLIRQQFLKFNRALEMNRQHTLPLTQYRKITSVTPIICNKTGLHWSDCTVQGKQGHLKTHNVANYH